MTGICGVAVEFLAHLSFLGMPTKDNHCAYITSIVVILIVTVAIVDRQTPLGCAQNRGKCVCVCVWMWV